jgi:hypothetical protein
VYRNLIRRGAKGGAWEVWLYGNDNNQATNVFLANNIIHEMGKGLLENEVQNSGYGASDALGMQYYHHGTQTNCLVKNNIFYGSKGYMTREKFGYKLYLGKERAETVVPPAPENHAANFLAAVRSRRPADLNAEIEEGAATCTLIHLANISYRLGRTLNFDAKTMTCTGDAEANRMLARNYRKPYVVPQHV